MQHDLFKVSVRLEFFIHVFSFFFFTGDSSRCIEFERSRQKIREGIRNRIYSRTIILPVIARHSSKEIAILRNSTKDMSQVPLIAAEETSTTESPTCNMVILEVKKEKQEKRERKKYIRVLQFFYFVTSLICYLFTFFFTIFLLLSKFYPRFYFTDFFFSSFINQFISFKNIQRLKKYFHLIFSFNIISGKICMDPKHRETRRKFLFIECRPVYLETHGDTA